MIPPISKQSQKLDWNNLNMKTDKQLEICSRKLLRCVLFQSIHFTFFSSFFVVARLWLEGLYYITYGKQNKFKVLLFFPPRFNYVVITSAWHLEVESWPRKSVKTEQDIKTAKRWSHVYNSLSCTLSLSYTHTDSSVMFSLSYTLTPVMYSLLLLHTQVLYTWSLNLGHSAVKEPFLHLHVANGHNSFYCDPTCLSRAESKDKNPKNNTFTALTFYGAD